MQVEMRVKGLEELDSKLAKLGASVGKKFLRGSMMTATLPTFKAAKSITPVGKYKTPKKGRTPGTLKKALSRKTMVGRAKDKHTLAVRLRFNRKKAFYWAFVTGGTKPHDMNAGSKTARRQIGFRRQKKATLKKRMHPGSKGIDILGIAFRVTKSKMLGRFTKSLIRRIDKAAR